MITQRDICVLIKKTPSAKEIATLTGLAIEQVKQLIEIARTDDPDDQSIRTRVKFAVG